MRAHATDIQDAKSLVSEELVDLKQLHKMVKELPDRDFAKYTRLNRVAVEKAVESFYKNYA